MLDKVRHRIHMNKEKSKLKKERLNSKEYIELKKEILEWTEKEKITEYAEEIEFIRQNKLISVFPYEWASLKILNKIKINLDKNGEKYISRHGKKLYLGRIGTYFSIIFGTDAAITTLLF